MVMLRDCSSSAFIWSLSCWILFTSGGLAVKDKLRSFEDEACGLKDQVKYFYPLDHKVPTVNVTLSVGKKLEISLEGFSDHSICRWMRGNDTLMSGWSPSITTSTLSEEDSGRYALVCERNGTAVFSKTVQLEVLNLPERPTKPRLLLVGVNRGGYSPYFQCSSDGFPKPKIEWSGGLSRTETGVSSISSSFYPDKEVLCCASNTEGQECTQLYDFDLDANIPDTFSNVTLSSCGSLLLRCRSESLYPNWKKDHKTLDKKCETDTQELCISKDRHDYMMSYLFIKSVFARHSGVYTCNIDSKSKSFHVHIQDESFLSAQLDESVIVPADQAKDFCLKAKLSYHPVLQECTWEGPDRNRTKCKMEKWVTKQKTATLCNPQKSGLYKLYLEAGQKSETKVIKVCVADKPKFWFNNNNDNSTLTFEAESITPVNYTLMDCNSNDNSETNSSCKVIDTGYEADPDDLCITKIKSIVNTNQIRGPEGKFCLTNPLGMWCDPRHVLKKPVHWPYRGDPPSDEVSFLLKIGLAILLLTLAIIIIIYFVKRKLQMIQMVGPNDNDYIYINFKDLDYDKKWEFPRENLQLGKELGSGAFGMMVQATALGINKPGVPQQVAVKMLKERHHSVEKEALMSELKMLTLVGHHSNIVNLLGACTNSGPVYLIFQYCCFGDLLNYLKENGDRYHKSDTDDFTRDHFKDLYQNLQLMRKSSLSAPSTTADNYVFMRSSATRGQEDIALLSLSSDDVIDCDDLEICESANDQTDDQQALTFDDLLSFALQVGKGMDFLSSKNCIHRDLAARNVLLAKGRVAKIGDFGLARDIDNDSNYVVRGNVRLPVKWMAPESIFDGMYTMKSNVWAYGILLWEIYSLGGTPYPGLKVDQTFYSNIARGFKMDRPSHANDTIYELMCQCWTLDPSQRPSFSKLVSLICDQLLDREEQLYLDMSKQTPRIYENAEEILDISALTKKENQAEMQNNYCQTYATERALEPVAEQEEFMKPSPSA